MLRQQLKPRNPADQIPFFRFVKHAAQRSKCTVGVRCRAAETDCFHIILGYVIQAHADDFRRRKQAPTVAVICFRLSRKGCRFDPTQKPNREPLQAGSLPIQRTDPSHGLGEPQSGNLPGSLLGSLLSRTSISLAAPFEVVPVKSRIPLLIEFHEFPPLQPARRRSCAPFRRKENKKMLAYAALPLLTAKWAKNSHSHRQ